MSEERGEIPLGCIPNDPVIDHIVSVGEDIAHTDDFMGIFNGLEQMGVLPGQTIERLSHDFQFTLNAGLKQPVGQEPVPISIFQKGLRIGDGLEDIDQ